MNFILREARREDLPSVVDLASSFSLLNLPADGRVVGEKLERSLSSFRGKSPGPDESEYFFVLEDLEKKRVCGTSLIIAKHGTEESPHTAFEVTQKEKFSKELGVGFIHQVLRMKFDFDGPTEIGGLLVSPAYRGRPEKLGKQISLVRFLYMAMYPDRFENRILCELTPPLSHDGRSEFWEALGRKFTGLPYDEADYLSRHNKEFIKTLFPEEDIYTCILDARARYVIGRVGLATMPAKHLLEAIGFKYLNEIDPFDGGPHYGAFRDDITVVKRTKRMELDGGNVGHFDALALVGLEHPTRGFVACLSYFDVKSGKLRLPEITKQVLDVTSGDFVNVSPISEGTL